MGKTDWINILLTLLWCMDFSFALLRMYCWRLSMNRIYRLDLQSISIAQSLVLSEANT